MRKSGQTSIMMVHMHLHARYPCSIGYLSCSISWFAELMVTGEIGRDDPRGVEGRIDGLPGWQWVAHE
ncbi:MAG: hypothetical protein JWR14_1972 [Caballeronia sp.]|jgi:hypothetical protein|nr:hypothetical protein [Caballeronia sp.]